MHGTCSKGIMVVVFIMGMMGIKTWGGTRGGSDGLVKTPKLKEKTFQQVQFLTKEVDKIKCTSFLSLFGKKEVIPSSAKFFA